MTISKAAIAADVFRNVGPRERSKSAGKTSSSAVPKPSAAADVAVFDARRAEVDDDAVVEAGRWNSTACCESRFDCPILGCGGSAKRVRRLLEHGDFAADPC